MRWWDDSVADVVDWGFDYATISMPVQLWHGPRQRARTGRELVQLDLQSVELSQRGDLVADEAPALGMGGVGEHVGDHERAQDPSKVALWNDGPRARRLNRAQLWPRA